MLLIKSNSTHPYFNLAAEEYLLKKFDEDFFMVWRSDPSVILGKHQNLHEEINIDFARSKNIIVARRISGGGTVYHDLDNINFTFIKHGEKDKLVDFYQHTLPIIRVLDKLGLKVDFEGKNDLRINGMKISGNAEHVYKNKVLHHGTLLFNSNLDYLNGVLRKPCPEYQSKSVKSIRSVVTNISTHLNKKMESAYFMDYVFMAIQKYYTNSSIYKLTVEDEKQINKLIEEKFATWEWIFGYSPKYTFERITELGNKELNIKLMTTNAIIKSAQISIEQSPNHTLSNCLVNIKHDPIHLAHAIKKHSIHFMELFPNNAISEFVSKFY